MGRAQAPWVRPLRDSQTAKHAAVSRFIIANPQRIPTQGAKGGLFVCGIVDSLAGPPICSWKILDGKDGLQHWRGDTTRHLARAKNPVALLFLFQMKIVGHACALVVWWFRLKPA